MEKSNLEMNAAKDNSNLEDKMKLKNRIKKASIVGLGSLFLAIPLIYTKFNKELKTEDFLTRAVNYISMYKSANKIRHIKYEELIKPTPKIQEHAKRIAMISKDENEAIENALSVISEFKYAPRSKSPLPQLPNELEISKEGDCNEFSFYLFSLLQEIEKNSNFRFNPSFCEVYISDKGEHGIHDALEITLKGKRIIIDPAGTKKIGPLHKMVRILTPEQVVATYYSDAGASYGLIGKYEEGEKYLIRALKIDPHSPGILYNISRIYSYEGKHRDALKYAKILLEKAPNWIYSYIRLIQIYYDMDDYERCKEVISKAKNIDPGNKVIEMYDGIIKRYESFTKESK